jgi:protein-S-isoprenylcysteine O-methyltransferase Ste14
MAPAMAMRMTIFGVGPLVVSSGIVTILAAWWATYRYGGIFVVNFVPYWVLTAIGIALVGTGAGVIAISAVTIYRGFYGGRLVTTGPYAWSRNPIYAAYILLIVPGIALLCKAWLILAASGVMYCVFKLAIGRETAFLREKFGNDFTRYQSSVNELLFCPPRNRPSA